MIGRDYWKQTCISHASSFAEFIYRIVVYGLLGPQMKLVDLMRKSRDNKDIPKILAERMFNARRRQEEAVKLKTFRAQRFGEYSTRVPGIEWTPHCDIPLPESDAQLMKDCSTAYHEFPIINATVPCVPGQKLYGVMIPRPKNQLRRNQEASMKEKERAIATLATQKAPAKKARFAQSVYEQGVEVTLEEKRLSARASAYFSNLFGWQKSESPDKTKPTSKPVRKKTDDDTRLSKFSVEVVEGVEDEGSLSQQKLKTAERGDDLWLSSMGFEVSDILDEETLAQLQKGETPPARDGERAYDLSVSMIGFEVDDILAEEELQQQKGNADGSEASTTDKLEEAGTEHADESVASITNESCPSTAHLIDAPDQWLDKDNICIAEALQQREGSIRLTSAVAEVGTSGRNQSVCELGVEILEEYDEEALLSGSQHEQSARDISNINKNASDSS
jgi:hypothetical protein